MAILWCGGEDIDFPNNAPVPVVTAGYFRSAYSRCGVRGNTSSSISKSNPFAGGAITSAWLSFRYYAFTVSSNIAATPQHAIGVGLSGTTKGLFVGIVATTPWTQVGLTKYDGTATTLLAQETGNSGTVGTINRIDMQIINYGTSATVNVYFNNSLIITFTGDVSISGMTNFDSVFMADSSNNTSMMWNCSEIIVANEDTRGFPGLATLALTGAGTTDQWTGVFSTINQTTINDGTPNYTNTPNQDQQFNVTDLPAGIFNIRAVKIAARSAVGAGAAVSKLSLGYNSGGTVAVGTPIVVPAGYATLEQLDLINPVTGVAWQQAEMNALQLDMRSIT